MTFHPSPAEPASQACPQCQHALPVTTDYVVWCPQCEWNMRPEQTKPPARSLFERMLSTISQRSSQQLFSSVQASTAQKPSLTRATAFAYSIAVGIYAITIAVLLAGIALIVYGHTNIFALVAGGLLLGMCWIVRPRGPQELPPILPRAKAPVLYAQIDAMCHMFGLKPIDGVIVMPDFQAGYGQRGWSRKQYVWVGLSLWSVLEPQEQLALLAHELAHGANGDPSRGWFLHSALAVLEEWYSLVRPRTFWGAGAGIGLAVVVALPLRLLALVFAWGLQMLMLLFAVLLWRTMQRAEYWADNMASQLSGTAATVALLEKLRLGEALSIIIERASWRRYAKNGSIFVSDVQQAITALPAHEHERLRRIALRDDTRVDTSHPPTTYRIAYLRDHPHTAVRVTVSREDADRMLHELMSGW